MFLIEILSSICKKQSPKKYLEIGTHKGESLITVIKNSHIPPSRIVCCDDFSMIFGDNEKIDNFDHIKKILKQIKYSGNISFLNGDSKIEIPKIHEIFDLILVDGDHSFHGAWQDLLNVWPLLEIGGLLVFDDLCHPQAPWLKHVFFDFSNFIRKRGKIIYYSEDKPMGVGVLRKIL